MSGGGSSAPSSASSRVTPGTAAAWARRSSAGKPLDGVMPVYQDEPPVEQVELLNEHMGVPELPEGGDPVRTVQDDSSSTLRAAHHRWVLQDPVRAEAVHEAGHPLHVRVLMEDHVVQCYDMKLGQLADLQPAVLGSRLQCLTSF